MCDIHDMRYAPNALDLVGQRFQRLAVISRSKEKMYGGLAAGWDCRCDCGVTVRVSTGNLRSGNTKSCGCLDLEASRERIRKHATIHGNSRHPLYKTWVEMLRRCGDPTFAQFYLYGGRGIRVCDEWVRDFQAFAAYMGARPPKHTVDRYPNGDGNYEPGNVRWATAIDQNNNRSNTLRITAFGRTQTIRDWADETGIPHRIIYQRLNRDKKSPEVALSHR